MTIMNKQAKGETILDRRNMFSVATAALAALPLLTAAAVPSGPRAARTSRELLKIFIEALNEHDMEKFASIYTPNGYIQHQTLTTNASAAGGREAVVSYFAKRIEAFPDMSVTTDATVFEGDKLCANLVYSGTHKGEYLGIAPTGRHVSFNSTDIIKVRGGLMVEHWGAADLYGLTQQLKA